MNAVTNEPILGKLEQRLGRLRARQRLGIERDHEAQIFGQGINFVHIENWYSIHSVIRMTLKLTGLYWRGIRNAQRIRVKHNDIEFKMLPIRFNSFTVLHISDLHVDMNDGVMKRLAELLPRMDYDLCVLTGDYRGATYGAFDAALEGLARVRAHLKGQIYGVLGNHDTIRMVPELEEMGIWMLLNECEVISRDNQHIYLPELMTHTIIASIILKRRPQKSLMAGFRSSCHTRRKFIARRHTPGSICSCPVTPMEARYVCPAQFRSLWIPFYPGIWGQAAGSIIIC